jgi:hypothetical protein
MTGFVKEAGRVLRGTNQAVGLLTMKWFNRTAQGRKLSALGIAQNRARPERAAEWRFYRDIVLGCPERSPFRIFVEPVIAMVAAFWERTTYRSPS